MTTFIELTVGDERIPRTINTDHIIGLSIDFTGKTHILTDGVIMEDGGVGNDHFKVNESYEWVKAHLPKAFPTKGNYSMEITQGDRKRLDSIKYASNRGKLNKHWDDEDRWNYEMRGMRRNDGR